MTRTRRRIPETPNSQEPTTVPSEAPAVEEDDQLTTKKPAEESEVIVIKPSEVEYKESNRIEYSSAEEQDKGEEGEQSVAVAKAKEAGTIIHRDDKVFRQKSNDKGGREN